MPDIDEQAALTYAEENTTHIEREVNEQEYTDIQYPFLIPVDTSAPKFTETVAFYTSNKYGKADWINGNSDDIPMAGTETGKKESSVYMAGIGYGWGFAEIERAMQVGHPLQSNDAMAARRAYEEFVEVTSLEGDARKGLEGLKNHSSVTASAVATGDWASSTADQILAEVNDAISSIRTNTKFIAIADTVLLPPAKLTFLATKRLGDTTETLLSFLRKNNVYTAVTGRELTLRGVNGLEDAGVGGVARMVAYRRDPSVLKLHMPMPHEFLPVQRVAALRYEVAGVFRLGGLDIRKPSEVVYKDGI